MRPPSSSLSRAIGRQLSSEPTIDSDHPCVSPRPMHTPCQRAVRPMRAPFMKDGALKSLEPARARACQTVHGLRLRARAHSAARARVGLATSRRGPSRGVRCSEVSQTSRVKRGILRKRRFPRGLVRVHVNSMRAEPRPRLSRFVAEVRRKQRTPRHLRTQCRLSRRCTRRRST